MITEDGSAAGSRIACAAIILAHEDGRVLREARPARWLEDGVVAVVAAAVVIDSRSLTTFGQLDGAGVASQRPHALVSLEQPAHGVAPDLGRPPITKINAMVNSSPLLRRASLDRRLGPQ